MQRRSLEVGFKQTQKGLQTYTLGESLRTFDESMSLGNYDGAREALFVAYKDGGLSEDRYRSLKLGVDKKEETDPINIHKAQNDVEAMQADIEMLKDPENKMALSWDEREAKVSELEGEISAENKRKSAMEKGATWWYQREMKSTINSLENGENLSASEVANTKAIADELAQRDDLTDSMKMTLADFYEAYGARDKISEFKKISPLQQEAVINRLRSDDMSSDEIELVRRFEKLHESTIRQLESDSITYAEDNLSMNVQPFNFQNIAGSLANRQVIYDATLAHTGIASGYLRPQEASMFAAQYNMAGTDQKLFMAQQVNDGLGVNAPFFWEQLKMNNVGAIAVAGQIYAEQTPASADVARTIIDGNFKRAEGDYELINEASDFDGQINSVLSTSYGFNAVERKYRVDAIKDAYASLDTSNSGKYDPDLLDQAIDMVTGGVYQINGVTITAPAPGVTENDMEKWVKNLPPAFIDSQGGSSRMSSEEISKQLRDGYLQLIPESSNSYRVQIAGTPTFLPNGEGTSPLVITYDSSAIYSKDRTKSRQESQRQVLGYRQGAKKANEPVADVGL
jgi:hypothetical protein